MAESPPRVSPHAGDGAEEGTPKDGAPDALSNPPGPKRTTTAMGLAPAPHLGGLSGSPGALARAEEEAARKKRMMARLSSTRPMQHTGPPPPPRALAEELTEQVPPAYTGPPPRRQTSAPPPAVESSLPPAPAFGQTTVLMQGSMPQIPLTLPAQPQVADSDALPASGEWDVVDPAKQPSSPDMASEPTILATSRDMEPRRSEAVQPAPITERMLRSANPSPTVGSSATYTPPTAPLALRSYEPSEPQHSVAGVLDPRLVLLDDPDSPRADGFRALRDNLLGKSLPRVIAVTSAAPNEGKTTCAINLALALSEHPTTKVLVVDANFFEPELGAIFKLDQLTSVAPSAAWLEPYAIGEITPNLHVAAVVGAKTKRRFEQHRFDALLDQLCRANYDYIVIDTPALRGSLAVNTLVACADGTLVAVRAGGTTTGQLRRAVEKIPANKILGVALIDAKTKAV